MKKLISILIMMTMLSALAACGANPTNDTDIPMETQSIDVINEENNTENDESNATAKPTKKPAENNATAKPAQKPASDKATEKPAQKPTSAPAEKPESVVKSIGQTLLSDFKGKSGMGTEAIANSLLSNSVIPFSGATMSVEPGLLTGFGNAEINGFKSGTMFAPMIGAIPFVGYIFELESGADASAFVSTLRSNANMRWNVCSEAEEMVTGISGNKVFFVMCPKNFDE